VIISKVFAENNHMNQNPLYHKLNIHLIQNEPFIDINKTKTSRNIFGFTADIMGSTIRKNHNIISTKLSVSYEIFVWLNLIILLKTELGSGCQNHVIFGIRAPIGLIKIFKKLHNFILARTTIS
jgi:hypothetical protein